MELKQVIGTNFAVVVKEIEELVSKGYTVVYDGESAPYHMIMGNFIVTLTAPEQVVGKAEAKPATAAAGDAPKRGNRK